MDFNTLLIWMVVISCGGMVTRVIRTRSWRGNAWAILSAGVLTITGIVYLIQSSLAGWIGGGLWILLFLIPSLLHRAMLRASMRQQYRFAGSLARIARLLHPWDGWWQQPQLLRALAMSERGDVEGATDKLAELAAKNPSMRRMATFQSFRISRRWNELIAWAEIDPGYGGMAHEPSLAAMYVRALGEVGALNEMVQTLVRTTPAMQSPAHTYTRAMSRLFVFAFCGDVIEVRALIDDALAGLRADVKEFWLATAMLAAGDGSGAERMRKLINTAGPAIRAAAEDRLARPLARASEMLEPLTSERLEMIARERRQEDRFYGRIGSRKWRRAATIALILANVAMFAVEIYQGGSENEAVLERLGAVSPRLVSDGDWWRIFAANFLHFGFAHVAFNMLALWILGPFVEAALGFVRYVAVYLVSGLLALSAALIILQLNASGKMETLVGASGCIMGLVGATIAILLRAHLTERAAIAAQRLNAVMVIVVVQLIFDAMTPQVSSTAHIGGMIAGFILTFGLKHRTAPPPGEVGRGFEPRMRVSQNPGS